MKIKFFKAQGGMLVPADEAEAERMTRFKNGEMYQVDIKLSRNPQFLAKIMVFFNFCFSHWDGYVVTNNCSEKHQFDRMRKDLTILAGFYEQSYRLDGSIRVEAKSLAFENMDEEEFTECYHAVINSAMKHIFKKDDENIYNQLMNFF